MGAFDDEETSAPPYPRCGSTDTRERRYGCPFHDVIPVMSLRLSEADPPGA